MTTKKEISWEFIRETRGQKYFLVKRTENEYFVFRTPVASRAGTKNHYSLANWEGEITPWGGIPAKVRIWLSRKRVKRDPQDQKILLPQN